MAKSSFEGLQAGSVFEQSSNVERTEPQDRIDQEQVHKVSKSLNPEGDSFFERFANTDVSSDLDSMSF